MEKNEIQYVKPADPITNNTQMPTEMHFEKASWWKRTFFNNKLLKAENERLIQEHMEWLKKMKDLNLEKEMVKDLATRQAVEIRDLYGKNYESELKLKNALEELKVLKSGIEATGKEVKAITIIKKDAKNYSPMIVTLDETATKVVNREMLDPTVKKVAVDNAKIAFVEMFDPVPKEELM